VARNAKNQHSTRQDPITEVYHGWGTTRINRRLRSSLASLNAAERDDLPNRRTGTGAQSTVTAGYYVRF